MTFEPRLRHARLSHLTRATRGAMTASLVFVTRAGATHTDTRTHSTHRTPAGCSAHSHRVRARADGYALVRRDAAPRGLFSLPRRVDRSGETRAESARASRRATATPRRRETVDSLTPVVATLRSLLPRRRADIGHFVPFHCVPFHSIAFPSIPFHSLPFHSIPFHSLPFHILGSRARQVGRLPQRGRLREAGLPARGRRTGRDGNVASVPDGAHGPSGPVRCSKPTHSAPYL